MMTLAESKRYQSYDVACLHCDTKLVDEVDGLDLAHGDEAHIKCPVCLRKLTIESDWERGDYIIHDGRRDN